MTVNEHLSEISAKIPTMSQTELASLIASLDNVKGQASWNLRQILHSKHSHHPSENKID